MLELELGGLLVLDPVEGTVGGVEPLGGLVVLPVPVLEPVLDPVEEPMLPVELEPVPLVEPVLEPVAPVELEPMLPELEPLMPLPLLEPLLIPLESMFFWMLAGQLSAIMSTFSTTISLSDKLADPDAPAPMLEAVEEAAFGLLATPVFEDEEPVLLSPDVPLMEPLVPPLVEGDAPLAACSVPCSFT